MQTPTSYRASDNIHERVPASGEISTERTSSMSFDHISSPIDLQSIAESSDEDSEEDLETVTVKIPKGSKDTYQGLRQLVEKHGRVLLYISKSIGLADFYPRRPRGSFN